MPTDYVVRLYKYTYIFSEFLYCYSQGVISTLETTVTTTLTEVLDE